MYIHSILGITMYSNIHTACFESASRPYAKLSVNVHSPVWNCLQQFQVSRPNKASYMHKAHIFFSVLHKPQYYEHIGHPLTAARCMNKLSRAGIGDLATHPSSPRNCQPQVTATVWGQTSKEMVHALECLLGQTQRHIQIQTYDLPVVCRLNSSVDHYMKWPALHTDSEHSRGCDMMWHHSLSHLLTQTDEHTLELLW